MLSLARTSGDSLPQRVAQQLANHLGADTVVATARALMDESDDSILRSVRDLGQARLRAVKVLLLGA